MPRDSPEVGSTANTVLAKEAGSTNEGCTKGACIEGIFLQQSCPWWPCGEQGIELQHRIDCSGVVIAVQSAAYVANANATTTIRIGRLELIIGNLTSRAGGVKYCWT